MKNKWKKLLGVVLTLALIVGLTPEPGTGLTAYADYQKINIQGNGNNGNYPWLNGHDWGDFSSDNDMSGPDSNGSYTKTYNSVPAGTYQFKFTDGSWANSWALPYGTSQININTEHTAAHQQTEENENHESFPNITFQLSRQSNVTITFNPTTKKYIVSDGPVTGVSINKTSTTLTVGGTETLTATVEPDYATDKSVTWSSDNTAVATVANGVVTAIAAGTANITATATNGTADTSDDRTATCAVTVTLPPPVASVTSGSTTTEYATFSEALSAWTAGTTLTLLADVEITSSITVAQTKTLDLAGKKITMTGNGPVFNVSTGDEGATFTLKDSSGDNSGVITGGTGDYGGGFYINQHKIFIMEGGTITGNNSQHGGGGVYLDGRGYERTFYLYGGVISGNTSEDTSRGANVFIEQNGNFKMTGGTIDGGFSNDYNRYVALSFNANGGTGAMSDQYVEKNTDTCIKANVNHNTNKTISDPAFSREGYTFVGWNTKADGTGTNYTAGTSTINISESTTLYAQWAANTYTVTFDANGGTGTMEAQTFTYGEAQALTANAFTRTGYNFAGWNTAADGSGTPYADGASITLTAPLTLYAQWTSKALYTVSGTVKQGGAAVSGVMLQLVQGEKKIAITATNAAGEFSFSAPDGIYNIVAEKAGKTKTALVTLNAAQTAEIVLPTENVSSTLTVTGSETPNVMVGGLDELAEANSVNGQTVTVTMTVEEKSDAANTSDIQTVAAENQTLDCLEIKIEKTVGSGTAEDVTDTGNKVLEIVVPYRFTGKENVEVYRYHGSAEKLEKLASKPTDSFTDGKYYPDTANGLLYIYASRFSTYAIGYTQCYNITGPIKYGSYTGTVTVSLLEGETVKYNTTASLSSGVGAYSFTHVLEGTYTLRAVWAEGGKEVTLSNAVTVR